MTRQSGITPGPLHRPGRPLTVSITEAEFQAVLVKTFRLLGWTHNHTRRAIGKGRKWTTPTSAIGFPDLVALRGPWLIACEVKSDVGKLTPEQSEWLNRFALLPCARTWVLRPSDPWEPITRWIQDPSTAPASFGWRSADGWTGDGSDTPRSGSPAPTH